MTFILSDPFTCVWFRNPPGEHLEQLTAPALKPLLLQSAARAGPAVTACRRQTGRARDGKALKLSETVEHLARIA